MAVVDSGNEAAMIDSSSSLEAQVWDSDAVAGCNKHVGFATAGAMGGVAEFEDYYERDAYDSGCGHDEVAI